eukprot:3422142-Amphidinium_carterae.3
MERACVPRLRLFVVTSRCEESTDRVAQELSKVLKTDGLTVSLAGQSKSNVVKSSAYSQRTAEDNAAVQNCIGGCRPSFNKFGEIR